MAEIDTSKITFDLPKPLSPILEKSLGNYENNVLSAFSDKTIKKPIIVTDDFGNTLKASGETKEIEVLLVSDSDIAKIFSNAITGTGDARYNSLYRSDLSIEENIALLKKTILEINEKRNSLLAIANEETLKDAIKEVEYNVSAWDPRLYRLDSFLMGNPTKTNKDEAIVIAPFASDTTTTAFYDMVFKLEAKVLKMAMENKNAPANTGTEGFDDAGKIQTFLSTGTDEGKGRTKIPMYANDYINNPRFLGAASLMNPYTLTKLVGSFEIVDNDTMPLNYMYDIRDKRRFYGISDTGNKYTLVLSPTVSHIIEWANQDHWGRTPYTFQDFVYSKWYGKIPNNRLITLRRYHAPTRDNLQFETMYNGEAPREHAYFAPRCTVISYIGAETGNTFNDLLKFTTGTPWGEAKADIFKVEGDDGDDHLATIDAMFLNPSNFTAENSFFNKLFSSAGDTLPSKILSFGKMSLAFNGKVDLAEDAKKMLLKSNEDPYNDTYQNRIQGPINRISATKRRTEGIVYESAYTVKCTYTSKSIGGINPKAAMLDILSNCLEMCSPTAVFWGGGHRFMLEPHFYPFHDGGWRDSFMEKLYQGHIFGNHGVISTTLKGLRDFGSKKVGNDTVFNFDNITEKLGNFIGDGLSLAMGMVSTITNSLFGESTNLVSEWMNKGLELLGGSDEDKARRQKNNDLMKSKMNNMFSNLETMWHSKVLASSTAPRIQNMASLLIGEPVGEWHLTVGNPLNPIIVVGNLICTKMDVSWGEELGPDDFPTELSITYSLEHGMQRDKAAIQSMFNRGMGTIYELPDYIKSTSEFETHVDHYTGGTGFREPKFENARNIRARGAALGYMSNGTYQAYKVDPGKTPSNTGNYNTLLVTKFNGNSLSFANTNLNTLATTNLVKPSTMPTIRSLAITRKFTS